MHLTLNKLCGILWVVSSQKPTGNGYGDGM